jgi:hypothetical protein
LGELEDASNALRDSLAARAAPATLVAQADGAKPANAIDESDAVAQVDVAGAAVAGAEPGVRAPADRRALREPRQVITTTMNTSGAGAEANPAHDETAPPPPVV